MHSRSWSCLFLANPSPISQQIALQNISCLLSIASSSSTTQLTEPPVSVICNSLTLKTSESSHDQTCLASPPAPRPQRPSELPLFPWSTAAIPLVSRLSRCLHTSYLHLVASELENLDHGHLHLRHLWSLPSCTGHLGPIVGSHALEHDAAPDFLSHVITPSLLPHEHAAAPEARPLRRYTSRAATSQSSSSLFCCLRSLLV